MLFSCISFFILLFLINLLLGFFNIPNVEPSFSQCPGDVEDALGWGSPFYLYKHIHKNC